MPLHDVKCSRCGRVEEFFWLPTERPTTLECGNCGSERMEILLGSPMIDMGGRPGERALEKAAADGVF